MTLFAQAATPGVWIEAEDAETVDAEANPWWYAKVNPEALSAGGWVHHYSQESRGAVTYRFEAPEAGSYQLWLRANPRGAFYLAALNGGEPRPVTASTAIGEPLNIAADGKADLRFVAWMRGGAVELREGKNDLRVGLESTPSYHGGLDVILFTRTDLEPNGIDRATLAGTRIFGPGSLLTLDNVVALPNGEPALDFSERLPIPAGTGLQGPVVGVTLEPMGGFESPEDVTALVRYLRRLGINQVNTPSVIAATGGLAETPESADRWERFHRWFNELKAFGIHSSWTIHGSFLVHMGDGYAPDYFAELPAISGEFRRAAGLVEVFPDLRTIQINQAATLLALENPATEKPYGEDPALRAVYLGSGPEANRFTSPFPLRSVISPRGLPKHSLEIRRDWRRWLLDKYGSVFQIKQAWGDWQDEDRRGATIQLVPNPEALDTPRRAEDQEAFIRARVADYGRAIAEVAARPGLEKLKRHPEIAPVNLPARRPVFDTEYALRALFPALGERLQAEAVTSGSDVLAEIALMPDAPFEDPALGITGANLAGEAGTLSLLALDGEPLAASARILVFGSAGMSALDGGKRVAFNPAEARLSLPGVKPARIQALDRFFVPTGKMVPVGHDGSFQIDGRYQSPYYLVLRAAPEVTSGNE